uniref:Uncharacterized protein n=1 Tax=Arundo donax TaxID=35708 RepID=A0A0A8ZYN6_ARUDO
MCLGKCCSWNCFQTIESLKQLIWD